MKWFCLSDNYIKGPYSTDELKKVIATLIQPGQSYVWTRGATEWMAADRWNPNMVPEKHFPNSDDTLGHEARLTNSTQTSTHIAPVSTAAFNPNAATSNPAPSALSASPLQPLQPQDAQEQEIEEVTQTKTDMMLYGRKHSTLITKKDPEAKPFLSINNAEKYRVQLNFIEQPQMTKDELMQFTAQQDDVSKISIYDNKTRLWKEVYAFPEIVEKLGLTRRKHPRVPILAQFSGTSNRHEKITARVITLSEGGIGLTEIYDLQVGDKLAGQITSPHFYTPLKMEADVTYSGHDGYVGLSFSQINDDAKSLILDYVKRFSHNS